MAGEDAGVSGTKGWRTFRYAPERAPPVSVRVGLIVLANDRVIEPELARMLPGDVALHATRIPMAPLTTLDALAALGRELDEAAHRLLPAGRPDVLAFGCTSCVMAIGEAEVARR
ncbi:MAG: hypothetical protein ACREGL_04190, partial [Alphaproteobacteria bacterium]